jgi:D-alanyl-D-alanine carboxypeptidase
MPYSLSRRQFIGVGAQSAALVASSRFLVVSSQSQEARNRYAECFAPLDRFVEQYMRAMNAPGMTLVMADRDAVQRIVTYGFSDPEEKSPVRSNELFEIGSISKSFVAHLLLQLHQEGKVDLQKPVSEYLPWFRVDSAFAPITVHHLLTHSAGLPDNGPLFPADPTERHRAAYAPGLYFHYCNMGYTALGHLVWTLDGRTLPESIRKRMLEPLDMTQSEPVIALDVRAKMAKNHMSFQNDRPYPRRGRLCEAPGIILTDGAGCVASTPRDMGLYIRMIANQGKGPHGPLLTPESFQLFSKEHIKAEIFGPTASYGYGIAVDRLDGHKVVRHTGGMISFASSIQVDVDSGVGAFASINAMQGYRPNPVTQYAMQLMRAQQESRSIAAPSVPEPTTRVKSAADYAASYHHSDGRKVEVTAEGENLYLLNRGNYTALESAGGDSFTTVDSDFHHFVLVFGRADIKDPKSAVVELKSGGDWFTNERYTGPRTFDYPKEWERFVGHYRNENPWLGSVRIDLCKGKLLADGVVPIEPGEGSLFFPRESENSPEWMRFADIVNGCAMRLVFSGENFWRVMTS